MPRSTSNDTIIVGAGLAGLICASHLADRGHPVTLFESGESPGGRAQSTDDDHGYHLNFGPHALYDEGALAKQLDALDIPVTGAPPGSPMYGLQGDAMDRLPDGPWAMLTTGLLSFGSKFALVGLMNELTGGPGPDNDGKSTEAWLDDHVDRPDLRRVVEALIRLSTYTADLDRLPADIMLQALDRALAGVTYLDGGWQSIVDALATRLRRAGGTLHTETPVTRIATTDDRRFSVHLRSGDTRLADRVVLATSPSACHNLLDDRTTRAAGIPDTPEPVEAACLDLGLDGLPHPDRPLALGLDTPTYVSDHGSYADLAPDGGTVLHAARYLHRDESPSPDRTRAQIEAALDTLQPGWRDRVVTSRFLSRIPVVSHLPAPDAGFDGRPPPVVHDIPGLYVTGDWVGDTGWLSNASAASARHVADAITDETSNTQRAAE